MGASHHALEDVAVLSALQNFCCFIPLCNSDVDGACQSLFRYCGPSYLRLGLGVWPSRVGELPAFAPIRKLVTNSMPPPKATVVGLGPVLLNTLPWILEEGKTDLFVVSEMPLIELSAELVASVDSSG